jgi:hypothetical protein
VISREHQEMQERAERLYPTDEFNGHLKAQVNVMKKSLVEAKARFTAPRVAIYHVNEEKGERELTIVFMRDIPADPDNKEAMFRLIGKSAAQMHLKVMGIFLICEAWSVEAPKDPGIRPSEHPDRVESVMVTGMTMDKRFNMGSIPITGRDENKAIQLGEPVIRESERMEEMDFRAFVLEPFWLGYAEALLKEAMSPGKEKKADAKAQDPFEKRTRRPSGG